MESRRSFVLAAGASCAAGLCSSCLPAAAAAAATPAEPMPLRWIEALLPLLERELDPAVAKTVLKGCAAAHWEELGMAERVAPYRGRLPEFLSFLSTEWGWRIEHSPGSDVILVDEAKDRCVCPLVQQGTTADLSLLCDCSEGFAERLFGAVVGHPVRAEVTRSILRGAASCQYRITL